MCFVIPISCYTRALWQSRSLFEKSHFISGSKHATAWGVLEFEWCSCVCEGCVLLCSDNDSALVLILLGTQTEECS